MIGAGASAVTDTTANVYSSITGETVASYSNDSPAILAPGGDASSDTDPDYLHWIEGYSTTTAAVPADRCSNSGGVCATLFNGTSQATPQVSAAVALLEAKHGGSRSLTPVPGADDPAGERASHPRRLRHPPGPGPARRAGGAQPLS